MVRSAGSSNVKLDGTLQEFLRKKVNSFIKWDLVRFFHDNPHTKDTADNVARYTGRDVRTVQRELDGLVAAGVLMSEEVSSLKVYSLSHNDNIRQIVDRFIEACHDRQFRVEAIHQVIQNMKYAPGRDY